MIVFGAKRIGLHYTFCPCFVGIGVYVRAPNDERSVPLYFTHFLEKLL